MSFKLGKTTMRTSIIAIAALLGAGNGAHAQYWQDVSNILAPDFDPCQQAKRYQDRMDAITKREYDAQYVDQNIKDTVDTELRATKDWCADPGAFKKVLEMAKCDTAPSTDPCNDEP
jgi:hypothetical protein